MKQCAVCKKFLHFVFGLGWCEVQFSSPCCDVVGGHKPDSLE